MNVMDQDKVTMAFLDDAFWVPRWPCLSLHVTSTNLSRTLTSQQWNFFIQTMTIAASIGVAEMCDAIKTHWLIW